MKTFKIIRKTDSYHARFFANGKCEDTIKSGMTLKEAQKELLDMYNGIYMEERPYAPNWGMAVIQSKGHVFGASKTLGDGTRSFDYDSVKYSIEEEE